MSLNDVSAISLLVDPPTFKCRGICEVCGSDATRGSGKPLRFKVADCSVNGEMNFIGQESKGLSVDGNPSIWGVCGEFVRHIYTKAGSQKYILALDRKYILASKLLSILSQHAPVKISPHLAYARLAIGESIKLRCQRRHASKIFLRCTHRRQLRYFRICWSCHRSCHLLLLSPLTFTFRLFVSSPDPSDSSSFEKLS